MDTAETPLPRTTVISVAYNSADVIADMLASVPEATPVIVVDNASTDSSADLASARGAQVVRLEQNQGFGRGCNAGAAVCGTEFMFFVNPDARLGPGAIAALERAADAYPSLVAANPLVVTPTGRVAFKTSSLLRPSASRMNRTPPGHDSTMPVLTGCAFFCRRADFERVGGFDHEIFLYHEDHDLAVRLDPDNSGRLWHVPAAKVTHAAGTSSPRRSDTAQFKGYHMARSRYHVLKKHGYAAAFLRTALPALFQMLLPHNLFSPRRLAKHRGQLHGAVSALKDGGVYTQS